MTETATPDSGERVSAWRGLPVWARVGVLALLAVVVALVAIVLIRVVTRVPAIPLGVTAVGDLRPGACLAEDGLDLAEYTVVGCGVEHPQQVFATADIELDDATYSLVDEALAMFADQVCDRYREYRLFLLEDLEKNDYEAVALDVPTSAEYEEGDTETLCVIRPLEGGTITGDVYRPMP